MSRGTVVHEMHFKKLENYCHSMFLAIARVIQSVASCGCLLPGSGGRLVITVGSQSLN
jgi:hypothetical protein